MIVIQRTLLIAFLICSGCARPPVENPTQIAAPIERVSQQVVASREIKKGMSQTDVENLLGAPSVVARDGEQFETWEYDKIAARVEQNTNELQQIAQSDLNKITMYGVMPRNAESLDSETPSERPLSVKIRFDRDSKVETLSYFISKH